MIYSYNTNTQAVAANEDIVYTIDAVKTGCTVTHAPGTSVFTLAKPGYYYVTVVVTGAATAAGTDPMTIALYNGISPIAGATASVLSTDNTDINTLTINLIIPVRPSCCMIDNTVSLVVKNTGVDATYSNATISITKIA